MNKSTRGSFMDLIRSDLDEFIRCNDLLFPENEVFRMDLHCHDHNSNVPDQILGRILNVPETWLPTKKLLRTLRNHGMDAFTITNHNNARSCFELQDKGADILVGAEFSCLVPDYQVGIHVLAYGFTPEQESQLNRHRKNLYAFLDFTLENDLPTIWAHPLYHYKNNGSPPMDFFNRMALVFERFEVLNGQRDTWQNMLVKRWIESLTEEKINNLSRDVGVEPTRYCRDPYRKSMSGGSDSHMGIFSGLTGVRLHVPGLEEKKKASPLSILALEAIREGRMAAFGGHNNSEKMMISFLDFACQIALKSKDPGLLRILLHKGDTRQKVTALLVSNGFAELRQHKVTMSFIKLFHESLTGTKPHVTKKWLMPKAYKPIFNEASNMASVFRTDPVASVETYSRSIELVFSMLGSILDKRISKKMLKIKRKNPTGDLNLNRIISNLELPSVLRTYLGDPPAKRTVHNSTGKTLDIAGFLDGLSFPFLTSAVILGAHFTAARVMYNTRPMLEEFSRELGCLRHPKRMLWLSDTWNDRNGVSAFLKSLLSEIQMRDLPIDIMICSENAVEEDHLLVVKPVSVLDIPFYRDQKIRIPNLLEIHHKFLEGEYDRLICSTEGAMGIASLYLKNAYSVPAFFYMHSDWKTFTKDVLKFDSENQGRFIRLIRAFYKAFDSVFVLNSDHYNWLINKKMALDKSSVFLTAHWPDTQFQPQPSKKMMLFDVAQDSPVILFAGRLSPEKGVLELPGIYKEVSAAIPGATMVIAGSGPAQASLREKMPDAIYLGWMDPATLPAVYASADILILPSRFDTFSCVVVEAMACGLPVIAYNTKGPKDIIRNGISGILVSGQKEMIREIIGLLKDPAGKEEMRQAAVIRSKEYRAEPILRDLLQHVELTGDITLPE